MANRKSSSRGAQIADDGRRWDGVGGSEIDARSEPAKHAARADGGVNVNARRS